MNLSNKYLAHFILFIGLFSFAHAQDTMELASKAFEQRNYNTAMNLYKEACKNRDPKACYEVGLIYQDVIGTAKSYLKSRDYYQKACAGNYGDGCTRLGDGYYQGDIIQKNLTKGIEFYAKGCMADTTLEGVCFIAGYAYLSGKDVKKDVQKGIKILEKGCSISDQSSCQLLEKNK
jgi:TPR repeat protein